MFSCLCSESLTFRNYSIFYDFKRVLRDSLFLSKCVIRGSRRYTAPEAFDSRPPLPIIK